MTTHLRFKDWMEATAGIDYAADAAMAHDELLDRGLEGKELRKELLAKLAERLVRAFEVATKWTKEWKTSGDPPYWGMSAENVPYQRVAPCLAPLYKAWQNGFVMQLHGFVNTYQEDQQYPHPNYRGLLDSQLKQIGSAYDNIEPHLAKTRCYGGPEQQAFEYFKQSAMPSLMNEISETIRNSRILDYA